MKLWVGTRHRRLRSVCALDRCFSLQPQTAFQEEIRQWQLPHGFKRLKALLGRGGRAGRRRPRWRAVGSRCSFAPRLEAFEDRVLPSTYTVANLFDHGAGSLRAAILSGDDTIDFAHGLHGTITLTSGELLITNSVTINGPGADKMSVSGNNASRVFEIAAGLNVTISGLTITRRVRPRPGRAAS